MFGLDRVHKELHTYHRLQAEWRLGPIKITLTPCRWDHGCPARPTRILHKNMFKKHTAIKGYDKRNKEWHYLGQDYEQAFRRVDHVITTYVILRNGPL